MSFRRPVIAEAIPIASRIVAETIDAELIKRLILRQVEQTRSISPLMGVTLCD